MLPLVPTAGILQGLFVQDVPFDPGAFAVALFNPLRLWLFHRALYLAKREGWNSASDASFCGPNMRGVDIAAEYGDWIEASGRWGRPVRALWACGWRFNAGCQRTVAVV